MYFMRDASVASVSAGRVARDAATDLQRMRRLLSDVDRARVASARICGTPLRRRPFVGEANGRVDQAGV